MGASAMMLSRTGTVSMLCISAVAVFTVPAIGIPTTACSGKSANLSATDCAVWQEFFDNGNGKSWVQCSSLRDDPCSCYNNDFGDSVACEERDGTAHITGIMLFGNGVSGSLPSSLGNLK